MNSVNTSTETAQPISQADVQAAEKERLKNLRGMLYDLLVEGIVMVRFTKVNGEYREMVCTLNAEHIPVTELTEDSEESTKQPNPEILNVWDTEKEGWRSFRLDSVHGFSV